MLGPFQPGLPSISGGSLTLRGPEALARPLLSDDARIALPSSQSQRKLSGRSRKLQRPETNEAGRAACQNSIRRDRRWWPTRLLLLHWREQTIARACGSDQPRTPPRYATRLQSGRRRQLCRRIHERGIGQPLSERGTYQCTAHSAPGACTRTSGRSNTPGCHR